ncbi:hypothetical protein CEUSTIGMA_g636.t1 [Chlamydomonas eustigma]|uniref:Uncharacterized protein n=1 Tax=Chlamydomonas eustigma TaxID=1157962 RepID=A0A250WQU3_9CHLO|nr:hypothetical protein CEUSTIGMA_g636.t1 [Chlamydomonas eustigma]|eukprot:GAX73183.1 hypothetical protein CEUSTIGMA_g636.t1 [Chlamydomonas eustigma]
MYFDLCIPHDDSDVTIHRQRLQTLETLGFNGACAVQSAAGQVSASDRCRIQATDMTVERKALPPSLMIAQRATSLVSSKPFQQFTRLTVSTSEPFQPQSWLEVIRSYDIAAVRPFSERALQQACTSLEVDIISLDLGQRLPFKLRPQYIDAACKRDVRFEIQYSSGLRDQASRRHLFSNAQALSRLLRGRNLVISSGARNMMELRGPKDIINMGTLFGMSQEKAKRAISENCEAVLARGAARKLHFGVMTLVPASASAHRGAPCHGFESHNPTASSGGSSVRSDKKKRVS